MTNDSVCRQTVTVELENGLHLVPCSLIAQFARGCECDVQISKDDRLNHPVRVALAFVIRQDDA